MSSMSCALCGSQDAWMPIRPVLLSVLVKLEQECTQWW
jgi:hypothetical protein